MRIRTLLALLMIPAAAACGGSSKATSTPAKSTPTTTAAPRTTTARADLQVDVEITGDSTATVKGTAGACQLGSVGDSYNFEGVDYPGLGPKGVLSVSRTPNMSGGGSHNDIKLVVGGEGYLTGPDTSGIVISDDGKSVTLDQPVSGSTSGGPVQHARVKGTIVCP